MVPLGAAQSGVESMVRSFFFYSPFFWPVMSRNVMISKGKHFFLRSAGFFALMSQ